MSRSDRMKMPGGFTADRVPPKSRYELSEGHPVWCAPTGSRGGAAQTGGALVISTDPLVRRAGTDVGYAPRRGMLRAPDVSVLPADDPGDPGWSKGVPPLAIEYADTGQEEDELRAKIEELLAAGTRYLWVVRLAGIRRVEVHEPGHPVRVRTVGEQLEAPGVLSRPVPVDALFDPDAAQRVALVNLLRREGYESLDAVREEGREQGAAVALRSALSDILAERGLAPDAAAAERIAGADVRTLERWIRRAVTARHLPDVFEPG